MDEDLMDMEKAIKGEKKTKIMTIAVATILLAFIFNMTISFGIAIGAEKTLEAMAYAMGVFFFMSMMIIYILAGSVANDNIKTHKRIKYILEQLEEPEE